MADDKDAFLKKLLATFRVEASEHLQAMSSGLLSLERATASERAEILEQVFREAHNLKGAARAVSLTHVERVCHSLESLFGSWSSNRLATTAAQFDLVHQALDLLGDLVSADTAPAAAGHRLDASIRALNNASQGRFSSRTEPGGGSPARADRPAPEVSETGRARPTEASERPAAEAPSPAATLAAGTIRIHTAKLDSIMRETEELLGPRLAAEQQVVELRETRAALATWKKERHALRLARMRRQEPSKLLEYFETESAFLKSLDSRLATMERTARSDHRSLAGMIDGLLHDVKESHMLPFSSLVEGLRKLVRDLARDHAKQVELVVHGSDIVIDRRILEEMKAPLQHLLRNAIDHGIETPAVREQKGKRPRGTIAISVSHRSNRIDIRTADDGEGIDVAKVKAAARELRGTSAGDVDALDETEMLSLIFQSGVSTSPMITEISGRGLGLAIVREKVDRLGGRIAVETRSGAGTTIRIDLPLTLATFRGVLVCLGRQRRFMIPAANVERVTRVAETEIRTVENRETVELDGRATSLVWLSDVLELPRTPSESYGFTQLVIVGTGVDRIAFRVDAVLSEQEVLVKGLGPQLARVRNVSGASVLGTGEVVPVLNVQDLMASAVRSSGTSAPPPGKEAAEPERRSILVVEDSITSRTLIKGILESAGYDVAVAVDGIDAYTALRTGHFDLIVTDVEMPRMDGFDLTAKVRADKSLAHTPVVLVTALESREHRERGIDVGASAYIVKSNFDQNNLLEVVRRLI